METKKKLLVVFGTRPEAIKMAPLVKAFLRESDRFETKVCLTAQHREMLDQVMDFFSLKADYDLDLMKPNQNLYSLTGGILEAMKPVLEDYAPDWVFVHGDTTTTMATSLAAYYAKIKVAHVEAGLRTFNKYAPFPEEMNRKITGALADLNFAPTEKAKQNLRKEGTPEEKIHVTGNTVIDALFQALEILEGRDSEGIRRLASLLKPERPMVLVTGHRRENFGQGFLDICEALKTIAETRPEVDIVYPVHLNPNVQKPVYELLAGIDNVRLIEPQPYESFVWLMNQAKLVITDSGGIQEEAPSLGKPVLVMRDTTERPEAVDAGTVLLVGTDKHKITTEALDLLTNPARYERMSKLHNPYGDGKACARIVDFLKKEDL